jgi:hypothetical protein
MKKLKTEFHQTHGFLAERMYLYFKDVDISKSERVRNPFAANNVSGLTTWEQEQLIDIPVTVP